MSLTGTSLSISGTTTLIGGANITGNTNITNYSGLPYYDQGAKAIDSLGNIDSVYMISLLSGTSNLLSNNILISGTSTLLYQTINLLNGYYTAMYQATDLFGNTGYNYRTINLISQPSIPIINPSLPILTFNNTNSLFFYSIHLFDKEEGSNYEFYPGSGERDYVINNVVNEEDAGTI